MNLLAILLGVMTFTVQSKSAVSLDGEYPYNMGVDYSNSSSQGKGNVGAGDVAQLRLTEMGGIVLEKVEVYVKSNASGGAGSFTVRTHQGTVTLASKSGTFKDWFGDWDNTNYHALTLVNQSVANVYDLTIHLQGTANSLHIEKYVLTYADAPARTVTLMNDNAVFGSLKESKGGNGVTLPAMDPIGDWWFVGWSETEFGLQAEEPTLLKANTKYYPDEDGTLWAVYQYNADPSKGFVTELESGVYRYVNSANELALSGVPVSGRMESVASDVFDDNQYYEIEFVGTDTAYITHLTSGKPVGYNGTALAEKASPWLVWHQNEETLFYTVVNGKNWVFWLNICDGLGEDCHAGLLQTNPVAGTHVGLMGTEIPENFGMYTCHPLAEGIEDKGLEIRGLEIRGKKILKDGVLYIIRGGKTYDARGAIVDFKF